MRIATLGDGYIRWGGGIDLLKHIIDALNSQANVKVILFLPTDGKKEYIKHIFRPWKRCIVSVLRKGKLDFSNIPLVNRKSLQPIADNFLQEFPSLPIRYYENTSTGLLKALKEDSIDIIFPSFSPLATSYPIPWVGYIADFQHRYIPDLFAKQECKQRDEFFSKIMHQSRAIFVASESVKNDARNFYPDATTKIFVLPFSPIPRKEWVSDDENKTDVWAKYNLPKKYFLISNQFWMHKDHQTAFQALALLHQDLSYQDIHIVCTGILEDYRSSDYINMLRVFIRENNLNDFVHCLGYIPKWDQIQILRHAVAIIQPTLFEGGPGGGAAYDCVAMGKPLILSDIPVNREIESALVSFFQPRSAKELAQKMREALSAASSNMSNDQLLQQGERLRIQLGNAILMWLKECLSDWHKPFLD